MLSNPSILVCTDFSKDSDFAIKAAAQVAQKTHGKVSVIHIAEVGFYLEWGPYGIKPRALQEEFMNLLFTDMNKRMKDQLKRCEVEAEIKVTMAATAEQGISTFLSDKKFDLLVMGSQGASGKSAFLVGGLTQKMAASSPIPLLIVRKKFELNKVAALVDHTDCMHEVLSTSQELSALFSGSLEVVSLWQDAPISDHLPNIIHNNEKSLQKLRSKIFDDLKGFEGAKIRVEVSREKSIARHLVEILTEGECDLAVMKRHRKNMMERYFIGSETARVLELFEGNLLICPPTKAKG